jgi:uncharacterized protein
MKLLNPDIYINSIDDLDLDLLKEKDITTIILDIDNTLMRHGSTSPDVHTISIIKKMQDKNFKLCIVSNAAGDRSIVFARELGLLAVKKARKPSVKGLTKALEITKSKAENTAMIGDQIFTDILGGNRAGLLTILVNPVDRRELFSIKLKRILEIPIMHRLKKERKM